jgi:hypothetical protein
VAPWIRELTHSHSSGEPAHRIRLPMNMISTSNPASTPANPARRSTKGVRPKPAARGPNSAATRATR